MKNDYRVLLPLQVNGHAQGEVFEHEFTAEEEADVLAKGLLEIVPRPYKVIGPRAVFETEPGEHFEAALRIENEAALIDGGHIERSPRRDDLKLYEKPKRKKKKEEEE